MLLEYDGTKFEYVDTANLTGGEIAAVERVTMLRQAQINFMARQCGCGHAITEHPVVDEEDLSKGRKCIYCSCDDPTSDVPMDVNTAFLWVSLKRVRPEMKFSDVQAIPTSEFHEAGEDSDPSTGGQPPESEPVSELTASSTSESSLTS